jgi:Zn-dependent M28 family amino/carboxypeptidase
MERTKDGAGYGKAAPWRSRAPVEGAKRGAIAAIIRSVGTDGDRAPHTGAFGYDDAVPKIPAGALSVPDAEVLHRTLAGGARVRLRLVLTPRVLPDAVSANVIGEVPGASRPDELVLLGAHLDSWDLGDGAADDGAGCAIVLEAARQISLSPSRPARTVRVVLFANEENGLRGARAYGAAHEAELGKHVAAIEADSGDGRAYATRMLGGEGQSAFAGLSRLLGPLGASLDPAPAEGGADLIPLRAAGVPLVDLRQDGSRYFDVHHTANDTLARIVKADLDHATAAVATMAYGLASTDATFGRIAPADRERRHLGAARSGTSFASGYGSLSLSILRFTRYSERPSSKAWIFPARVSIRACARDVRGPTSEYAIHPRRCSPCGSSPRSVSSMLWPLSGTAES